MPKAPSELPASQVSPDPKQERRTPRRFITEYKLQIIGAVSRTTRNLSLLRHCSGADPRDGKTSPRSRACLRQSYKLAVEIPSASATSGTVRFIGGASLRSTASLRSSEYCFIRHHL